MAMVYKSQKFVSARIIKSPDEADLQPTSDTRQTAKTRREALGTGHLPTLPSRITRVLRPHPAVRPSESLGVPLSQVPRPYCHPKSSPSDSRFRTGSAIPRSDHTQSAGRCPLPCPSQHRMAELPTRLFIHHMASIPDGPTTLAPETHIAMHARSVSLQTNSSPLDDPNRFMEILPGLSTCSTISQHTIPETHGTPTRCPVSFFPQAAHLQ